ncbi:MAG TPA: haloacid dehalogenase type II, partial [Acidimicrobiia bacterium]|nr:haloacid dehalogenase type II [Acidimicrobiia bacterium]
DPATYLHAAGVMDVEVGRSMLISAHDWDVAGALQAGAGAAFVRRSGSLWSLPQAMPDLIGSQLTEIADQLVAS